MRNKASYSVRGGGVLLFGLAFALAWRAAAVSIVLDGTINYTSEWTGAGVNNFSDIAGDVTNGTNSGYDITGVSFYRDTANNALYIAMDTLGIAGDADGNGNPALWGTVETGSTNQIDPGDYGWRTVGAFTVKEAFGVLIDMDRNGTYDYVVGVSPLRNYTSNLGLYAWSGGSDFDVWNEANWGAQITAPAASPSPSSSAPDIELQITLWTTRVSDTTPWDFDFRAANGALGDPLGEDYALGYVPEPGSLALAGLAAAGVLLTSRRRLGTSTASRQDCRLTR